jgi:DNA polymerase III epsilon subunit-like protein
VTDWTSLRYVVLDVEGNGQQPPDLVELGTVPIVGGVIGQPSSWLVQPDQPITPFARKIHGIRNEDVAASPVFADIEPEVLGTLDGAVLVAHNAHVDVDVMRRKLPGWQCPEVFDTLKLARRLLPGHASYRLGALVEAFNLADGLPDDLTPHRATYDALVTAQLFVRLATSVSLEELRGQTVEGGNDDAAVLF